MVLVAARVLDVFWGTVSSVELVRCLMRSYMLDTDQNRMWRFYNPHNGCVAAVSDPRLRGCGTRELRRKSNAV